MKAMKENGLIINIVPDTQEEKSAYTYETIVSVDFTVPEGGLIGSTGGLYYLDNGVLKAYTQKELEATPEYQLKKKQALKAKYEDLLNGSDILLYDALEDLLKDTKKGKEWLAKKNEIKGK